MILPLIINSLVLASPQIATDNSTHYNFTEQAGVHEFTGRLIVRPLQSDNTREQAQALMSNYSWIEYVKSTDEFVIVVPEGQNETSLANYLMSTGLIQYAEPDYMLYPVATTPNDPMFGSQWQHSKMRSTEAWDFATGDNSFIVCTVDTGVDLNHPDLQANLISGYNSADRVTQANGGNVNDVNGHGTATIGCVGAIGNNGTGVSGMAWDVSLMPVRCSNSSGGGAYLSDLTDGARWAVDNGARSISVSYSGGESSSVETTGSYIKSQNGLVCWSSGNYGNQVYGSDHQNVIIVGATTSSDNRASWSTYGDWIDVAAPGSGVLTTANGGGYSSVSGTSFSAPIVNGVIAMMMIASPNSTPNEIEQMLFSNCADIGPTGEDIYTGHGRPDFYDCMAAADAANGGGTGGNDTVILSCSSYTPNTGSTIWLSANSAPSSVPYRIVWSLTDNSPLFSTYNGIVHSGTTTSFGTLAVSKVVPNRASGRTVFMEMQCTSGGTALDSNTIRLDIP
ncbi:MAG: S8 family serine peptidase [Planctomycetota bacterium]|jgi:subtilisin family serine protease|nr:S8 family serine peptidase [Planctomycetota bacterium]